MKICILNIATNKYIQFVDQLLESVKENFLNGHEITSLIFTEHEMKETPINVKISKIDHEPWPMPTLKRYNYFVKEKEYISEFDYVFYMDIDMRINKKVGDEILGDLVATQHPGFWYKNKNQFTYERRPISTAYIPPEEERMYYAGGFNGGKPEHFLKMAETISNNVNVDFSNGVVACWHDESHMNRYLIDNPPTVELTPSYCYPETGINNPEWNLSQFDVKIIALDKNHEEIRS